MTGTSGDCALAFGDSGGRIVVLARANRTRPGGQRHRPAWCPAIAAAVTMVAAAHRGKATAFWAGVGILALIMMAPLVWPSALGVVIGRGAGPRTIVTTLLVAAAVLFRFRWSAQLGNPSCSLPTIGANSDVRSGNQLASANADWRITVMPEECRYHSPLKFKHLLEPPYAGWRRAGVSERADS